MPTDLTITLDCESVFVAEVKIVIIKLALHEEVLFGETAVLEAAL